MLEPVELDGGIAALLGDRTFAAMAGRDRAGRLWLSPLTGRPGFLHVASLTTLEIGAAIPVGDPCTACRLVSRSGSWSSSSPPGEIETCTSSGETASSSLTRKWKHEQDYALRNGLWGFREDRIAVRFQYEWHDGTGQWWRSYGNELWEFAPNGLMSRREASNDPATSEPEPLIGPGRARAAGAAGAFAPRTAGSPASSTWGRHRP
jgi:Protein of unknown function (DUF1348)